MNFLFLCGKLNIILFCLFCKGKGPMEECHVSIVEELSMWVPCAYWDAMWHVVGPTSLALTKLQTAPTFLYELRLTRCSHHCD